MSSDTLIRIWILVFPVGIFEVSTWRKWRFDFIPVRYTITDFQVPQTLLVHSSCGEMERCEKRAFQVVSTQQSNVYINFNKNNENLEIFFTRNRVWKHKNVVSNQHVCTNEIGKI